jgi:predicted ATPase
MGIGFSQMMPLVASAFGSENRLIAIEQPELHIHPALQTKLADLFIQSAKERGNRFLIETHSEHLILRLLLRVRETTEGTLEPGKSPIRPSDLSVLYVQPGDNGSEVVELPVTEDGDFAVPWPNGFFAERADELF